MKTVPAYIRIAERIKADWFADSEGRRADKLPTQEELATHYQVSRSTIVRSLSHLVAEGHLRSQQGSGVYVAKRPPQESPASHIGLIVPSLHSPVIVAVCQGAERRARQLGMSVLLASSDGSLANERNLVEQRLRAGAKGVVLYPATRLRQELVNDYLTQQVREMPVVTVDIGCVEWACTQVQFDNFRLGYDLTRQLLRHGHRHIAFMHIATERLHSSIHERQRGWQAALKEANSEIPASYIGWPHAPDGYTSLDFMEGARNLLALEPRPDAVIAWHDLAAVHLTQALITLGVDVPHEIRIAGFDCDPLIARFFRPLFPTSKPDFARLGEQAVDALLPIAEGERTAPRIYYYPVPTLWREDKRDATSIVADPWNLRSLGELTPDEVLLTG